MMVLYWECSLFGVGGRIFCGGPLLKRNGINRRLVAWLSEGLRLAAATLILKHGQYNRPLALSETKEGIKALGGPPHPVIVV